MSRKSSLPQAAKSVSVALTPDTPPNYPAVAIDRTRKLVVVHQRYDMENRRWQPLQRPHGWSVSVHGENA